LLPSSGMPRGPTTKYGTFVPSADVASYCVISSADASNRSGIDFTFSTFPDAASASQRLFGRR
jgi:hypothetical protein